MPRTEYTWGTRTVRSNRYGWGQIHKAVTMHLAERHGAAEIAEAAGMTEATFRRIIAVLGLTRPRAVSAQLNRARLHGKDYAALEREAVRLWRQGCTGLEIESLLGLGKGSASRMLRRRRVRVCRSEALRRAWRNGRRQQGRTA